MITNTTKPTVAKIENVLMNIFHRLYLFRHLSCSCFISSIDNLSYFIYQIRLLAACHFSFGTFTLCDTVRSSILEDVGRYFHALSMHLICYRTDFPLGTIAATMFEEVEK